MKHKADKMKGMFAPRSTAVIGASDNPGKLGFHVMKSLITGGYAGRIVPINPGAGEVADLKAFPSITDCAGWIDLAVVVLPARLVPGVFRECAAAGVMGIVLITAGFKEIEDPVGADLHDEIAEIAHRAEIPVIGPNTFGMVNLHADLNASFTPEFSRLKRGSIALVSQSGGISHLIAFLAMETGVGLGKIIGLGNRLNVDFAQAVDFLMDDPDTGVIMLYMEGIEDPRRFLETVKTHRGKKPIIINKTGSSKQGDRASLSHTGSVAGSHRIYTGSFTQAGIIAVGSTQDLLDGAKALAACPILGGPGVAVLSGQAGPGMAACDVCEAMGLRVVPFADETQEKINDYLPPLALRTNPVDMGPAWYDSLAIAAIIRAVMDDENVDGILLFMMFASANAEALKGIGDLLTGWAQRKPVVSCILSPPGIWDDQVKAMEDSGALINYPTPERAARAMAVLWEYRRLRLSAGSLQEGLSHAG